MSKLTASIVLLSGPARSGKTQSAYPVRDSATVREGVTRAKHGPFNTWSYDAEAKRWVQSVRNGKPFVHPLSDKLPTPDKMDSMHPVFHEAFTDICGPGAVWTAYAQDCVVISETMARLQALCKPGTFLFYSLPTHPGVECVARNQAFLLDLFKNGETEKK